MNKLPLIMSLLLLGNGAGIAGTSIAQQMNETTMSSEHAPPTVQSEDVNPIQETSENLDETTSSLESEADSTTETTEDTYIDSENAENTVTSSNEEEEPEDAPAPVADEISAYADQLQADDGYWLVGDLATLRTYIVTDKKKEIRLTADIDIAATGLPLYDGFVLDGNGHTITYNIGGTAAAGFYVQETGATVTMKNVNIGTADGAGATGYYGIITAYDANPNISLIYENINYTTTNGQPLYNTNGKIIFRGNNTFNQRGTSTYSQEWAESNYIEIESGTTTVINDTGNNYAFIYGHGTNSSSPYASSVNLVVRSGATFDVQTCHAFFYSSASFNQSLIVEDNATLRVKQTGTDTIRRRFIYPDLSTSSVTDFRFGANANVQLDLKVPIPLNSSRGGMIIGEGADYEMNVEAGQLFSLSTSGTFSVDIDHAKRAAFNGTANGLGLRSSSTAVSNLSFRGTNRMKVDTYSSTDGAQPSAAFTKRDTALYATNVTYQNVSGDALTATELNTLATAKKVVFSNVWVPEIQTIAVSDESSRGATLSVTSDNYGSAATQVKYYLFTNETDTGSVSKAKHIYTQSDLSLQPEGSYTYEATDLNPNTQYWLQAMVTNVNGQSDWSQPLGFITDPDLDMLTISNEADLTETTAKISGMLANNTGVWTDYSNGEESPIPNQAADYGASYSQAAIQLEYSRTSDFSDVGVLPVMNRFGANASQFQEELTELRPSTTYYVRVRATAASGKEVIFPLVYEFETRYGEYIDVSIPVEMLFGTDDKEANTEQAGTIHSKGSSYEIENRGNVNTAVQITGFTPKNEAAQEVILLPGLSGQAASNQLALKLLTSGAATTETFLTPSLSENPVSIGTMDTSDANKLQLDFSGMFYNPLGDVLQPSYTMTLKFEKAE